MRKPVDLVLPLIALALAFSPTLTPVAEAKALTVKIYHVILGPVYQTLANGSKVWVRMDVYYPDTLVYMGPSKGLGTVNITVSTNWTGLWNGIVTVLVVDPGYRIDPTTFKPVNYEFAWASGGGIIGSGSIHYVGLNPALKPVQNLTITVYPHTRYFESEPWKPVEAQYFFKVRIALFAPDGSKVLGGDILLYTTSDEAPYVKLIPVKTPVSPHTAPAAGKPGSSTASGGVAKAAAAAVVAIALLAYVYAGRLRRSR